MAIVGSALQLVGLGCLVAAAALWFGAAGALTVAGAAAVVVGVALEGPNDGAGGE